MGKKAWKEPGGAVPFQKAFWAQAVESEMADVQKQHSGPLSIFTEVKMNHNPFTTVDAFVNAEITQR